MQQLAHDNVVLQAAAFAAQEQDGAPRRVVPRCLGKWRGSTLSGYLSHDDTTYKENFRCTDPEFEPHRERCGVRPNNGGDPPLFFCNIYVLPVAQ